MDTETVPVRPPIVSVAMVLVAGMLVLGIIIGIAAYLVVKEAGRISREPPPAVFDVEEAFAWVVQHVPDDVAATLTPDDVRRILDFQLEYFQRTGVSGTGRAGTRPVRSSSARPRRWPSSSSGPAATGEAYLPGAGLRASSRPSSPTCGPSARSGRPPTRRPRTRRPAGAANAADTRKFRRRPRGSATQAGPEKGGGPADARAMRDSGGARPLGRRTPARMAGDQAGPPGGIPPPHRCHRTGARPTRALPGGERSAVFGEGARCAPLFLFRLRRPRRSYSADAGAAARPTAPAGARACEGDRRA